MNHINVYSKSESKLGRMLSNFYRCDVHTKHGKFKSVEGYWYYLQSGYEPLRNLSGYEAKKVGREVREGQFFSEKEFQDYILLAIAKKILYNKEIYNEFIKSELPFEHYYIFNGKRVYPEGNGWIVEFLTFFRDTLKRIML